MTTGLRAAVFIDRDGTLVPERYYLADPEEVSLVPGAAEALASLRQAGFALVVVTNQSGIARGIYTLADYHAVAAGFGAEGVLSAAAGMVSVSSPMPTIFFRLSKDGRLKLGMLIWPKKAEICGR